MKKTNLSKLLLDVRKAVSKHAPEIMVGVGIAGMWTTVGLAVKSTPKAVRLIEEEKEKQGVDKLTVVDTVKTTWKCYLPAAITGITSTACLIGSTSLNTKRTAALATAYKIAETSLSEYKDGVVETISEKKVQEVKDKVAKKAVEKDPVSNKEVVILDSGNTLCYDALSGRYFKTDVNKIKEVENDVNRVMIYDMNVSLNEFYDKLGLPRTDIGDDLGWCIDDGKLEIEFSSQLNDRNEPCLVLSYSIAPKYNYYKLG